MCSAEESANGHGKRSRSTTWSGSQAGALSTLRWPGSLFLPQPRLRRVGGDMESLMRAAPLSRAESEPTKPLSTVVAGLDRGISRRLARDGRVGPGHDDKGRFRAVEGPR